MFSQFSLRLMPLRRALVAFGRDQRGAVLVETVIILPAVLWAFFALYIYFDAFAQQGTTQRATYTIADLISRQDQKPVTPDFLEGINGVFDFINDTSFTHATTHIRVSDIYYDYTAEKYKIKWTHATRSGAALTEAALNTMANELPKPADGSTELLVESWMSYQPAFDVGVDARDIYTMFVTAPRYSPDILYDDGSTTTNSNNGSTASASNNGKGKGKGA